MINSPTIIQMIEVCASENEQRLLSGDQIGDDDIISDYFSDRGYPSWIQPLPQLAFPTGNMLTQYISKPAFRPVEPPKPILFHANYIIGQKNKATILEMVRRHMRVRSEIDIPIRGVLTLRMNFYVVRFKFWLNRPLRLSIRYLVPRQFKKVG